jgi:spore coat-associated protein N
MNEPTKSGISRRVLLSLGVLGAVGAIAGLGTYAQFTDSTTASNAVSTGTVDINLAGVGVGNRLSVAATAVAATDTIERAVNLSNSSTIALSGLTLGSVANAAPGSSSLLDTDATDGLQLQIDSCPTAWTEAGTAPAYTYTCAGGSTSVLASGPVIRAAAPLSGVSLGAGATTYLRMKWTMPDSDNTFQGQSSLIDYNFVATQRAGTSR